MCNLFELTHVPACGKTAVSGSTIENKNEKNSNKVKDYRCNHNIIDRDNDGYVRCKSCEEIMDVSTYYR